MGRYAASSTYLTEPYVAAVLPHGLHVTPKLFNLERVTDLTLLERVFSLEYLIQQFGDRIRDDFRSSFIRVHDFGNNAGIMAAQKRKRFPVPL